jgi:Ca2+-transporting ATPase
MFALLLGAGFVYLVLGDFGEALFLLAFATLSIVITIVQESRSERVLDALRDLTSPRALVIRDGERRRIAGRDVVRADAIVLSEGDRVPADAVLRSASGLQTDESLLTGESVPVRKLANTGAPQPAPPGGDDLPFVYSGTLVVRGHGIAEVIATGPRSEIGKIGQSLGAIEAEPTPLQRQTRRLVKVLAVVGIGLSILATLLYALTRGGWLDGILAGITLSMSMLPEEFPLVLTVFMVMGAWRISQQRVLTRRSAVIETLGAATVLCTDKTGTLTLNRMSIAELAIEEALWTADRRELPEAFHELLEFGILASEQGAVDSMDLAFHELGRARLASTEHLHGDWALAHEYPLSPALLAISHVWKARDRDDYIIAAKGAPEAIADLCHMSRVCLGELEHTTERMAARGMRVLGVAKASFKGDVWPGGQHDFDFQFLGLVGLADPLRPTVLQAVGDCRAAGIRVVMITGDYPATARAIATQAGIDVANGAITGDELRRMADEKARARIAETTVFARISPEQKLRIVDALKANGEVVAMTGDGVNDAPALKSAHIGIAMGARGTDVAREAASIVLLDDDFGSIVSAVRLGRRIYDNLQKAMGFVLAVHVPIAGLSLLPLLFDWPLIFTPVHIAFLELTIDPICSVAFEAEPEERDIMRRRPRNRNAPLFSRGFLAWCLFQGGCVLVAVGAFFLWLLSTGIPEAEARAAAFTALVAGNFSLIVVNRSFGASLMAALLRPNRVFWWMFAAICMLLAAALLVPPARALFHFRSVHAETIGFALGVGFLVMIGLEFLKGLGLRLKAFGSLGAEASPGGPS